MGNITLDRDAVEWIIEYVGPLSFEYYPDPAAPKSAKGGTAKERQEVLRIGDASDMAEVLRESGPEMLSSFEAVPFRPAKSGMRAIMDEMRDYSGCGRGSSDGARLERPRFSKQGSDYYMLLVQTMSGYSYIGASNGHGMEEVRDSFSGSGFRDISGSAGCPCLVSPNAMARTKSVACSEPARLGGGAAAAMWLRYGSDPPDQSSRKAPMDAMCSLVFLLGNPKSDAYLDKAIKLAKPFMGELEAARILMSEDDYAAFALSMLI